MPTHAAKPMKLRIRFDGIFILISIFKKPLQEMGQVFYSISGSFDEPIVDTTTNARMFATHAALAGCIEE